MSKTRPEWIANAIAEVSRRMGIGSNTPSQIEAACLIVKKHCPEEYSGGLWAKMCVTQQAAEKLWKEKAAIRIIGAVCHQFSLLAPPATKLSAETRNWLIEEGAAIIREEKEKL